MKTKHIKLNDLTAKQVKDAKGEEIIVSVKDSLGEVIVYIKWVGQIYPIKTSSLSDENKYHVRHNSSTYTTKWDTLSEVKEFIRLCV